MDLRDEGGRPAAPHDGRRSCLAETEPWRYELIDGAVHEKSPETVGHAKAKATVFLALLAAIRRHFRTG